MPFSKLILVAPIILVMSLDMIFTLICQSSSYWQDYDSCNEGNPVARSLLCISPAYFTFFSLVYGFLVIFLIIKMPKPINILLVGIVLGAHANASVSWLPYLFGDVFSVEADEFDLYLGYLITVIAVSLAWFGIAYHSRNKL